VLPGRSLFWDVVVAAMALVKPGRKGLILGIIVPLIRPAIK